MASKLFGVEDEDWINRAVERRVAAELTYQDLIRAKKRMIRSKPPADVPEIVDATGVPIESVPMRYDATGGQYYPAVYGSQMWSAAWASGPLAYPLTPGPIREIQAREARRPREIVDPHGQPVRSVFVEKSRPTPPTPKIKTERRGW